MNKAKLFLAAIGIFAIVGGALAFNAKSAFTTVYCTTTQLKAENKGCSQQANLKLDASGTSWYYTIKGVTACSCQRICNETSTKFVND